MRNIKILVSLLVSLLFLSAAEIQPATDANPYVIVDAPLAIIPADTAVWIKWAGIDRTDLGFNGTISDYPDSGFIYVSKNPGGSNLDNYTRLDESYYVESNENSLKDGVNVKGIKFIPADQPNLEPGAWYLVVGFPIDTLYKDTTIEILGQTKDTTIAVPMDTAFVSNEIPFIVKHNEVPTLVSPTGDTLDDVTPTFKWNTINGVPYYHIIVSDDEIVVDSAGGTDSLNLEGVSIIWQAITPGSEITYGAPDPSGTITATPPPLSPGQQYTWLVLNNYGNNIAMTAADIPLPGTFTIAGEELLAPVNISPVQDTVNGVEVVDTFTTDSITLKWTNLDPNANTYKVYLYKRVEEGGLEVQLAVWDKEYLASKFTGDTATVTIDAKTNLVTNYYTWRVIAVDKQGKGSVGKYSKFFYDVPTGTIKIWTKEQLSTGGELGISFVELDVEVLEGTMENILFVTDQNGYFTRERTPGRLKITANKDGYESVSKIIDVVADQTETITFYMKRPEATIYGKVVDNDGLSLNLAKVVAVSDKGDTARAETDPNGNYVLNCYEDDWNISVSLTGYSSPSPIRVSLGAGVNYKVPSSLVLTKNSYGLSGKVLNEDGKPVVAALVQLFSSEGVELDRVEATSSNGSYSFFVNSGTYTIKASKTGFLSQSVTLTDVTTLVEKNLTLQTGTLLLQGTIYQKSWNSSGNPVIAAITNLKIDVVDETTGDTVETAYSDANYGDYSISVPKIADPTKYHLYYSKSGLQSGDGNIALEVASGDYILIDTISTFASLGGTVTISGGSTVKGDVVVTLLDESRATIFKSVTSDALGEFTFFNMDDVAQLSVTAGGDGYVKESLVSVDYTGAEAPITTLSIVDGRVLNGATPVKSMKVAVKEGTGKLTWNVSAKAADTTLAKAAIKIKSPVEKQLINGDTLENAGSGDYIVSVSISSDTLLDLAEQSFPFSDEDALLTDTVFTYPVSLPLYHKSVDTMTAVGGQISLALQSNDPLTTSSVVLYYKDINSEKYTMMDTPTVVENGYTFIITPPKSGSSMLYYFVVKTTDGRTYGFAQETFETFIKPDAAIITKLASVPVVDTAVPFVLPLNGSLHFDVKGYYGDNFTEITSLRSPNVTWRVVNANNQVITTGVTVVSDGVGATPGATVTATGVAENIFVEATFVAGSTGLTLKTGLSGTIRIPITVIDKPVDSLHIRISGKKPISGFYLNSSAIQLLFDAYTAEGTKLNITPKWSIKPESAGSISAGGILTTVANFSGPLEIYAGINDTLLTTYRDGEQKGILVGYQVTDAGGEFSDLNGLTVTIPANAVKTGESVELCLKRPILKNNLFKTIPDSAISLVSKVFEVVKYSDNFNTDTIETLNSRYVPAEQVTATVQIPEKYHKYLAGNESDTGKFSLGIWEDDSLTWDHKWRDSVENDTSKAFKTLNENLEYSSDKRSFTFPIGNILNEENKTRVGVLYRDAENLRIDVTVSPNPFSPYVSPLEDYKDVEGMNSSIKGTCIKIEPGSKTGTDVPKIDVNIYTAAGTLVWSANLNVTTAGNEYYLFWDGRTRIERSDISEIISVEEGVPIVPKGDNMCRNGRYFAVITIDDGKTVEHLTKEIILFK